MADNNNSDKTVNKKASTKATTANNEDNWIGAMTMRTKATRKTKQPWLATRINLAQKKNSAGSMHQVSKKYGSSGSSTRTFNIVRKHFFGDYCMYMYGCMHTHIIHTTYIQ